MPFDLSKIAARSRTVTIDGVPHWPLPVASRRGASETFRPCSRARAIPGAYARCRPRSVPGPGRGP